MDVYDYNWRSDANVKMTINGAMRCGNKKTKTNQKNRFEIFLCRDFVGSIQFKLTLVTIIWWCSLYSMNDFPFVRLEVRSLEQRTNQARQSVKN